MIEEVRVFFREMFSIRLSVEQKDAVAIRPTIERPPIIIKTMSVSNSSFADAAKEVSSQVEFGETISAMKLIYIGADDRAYVATSEDSYMKARVVGISLQAGAAGQIRTYLLFGRLEDTSFIFANNSDLYLGTNGEITTIYPTSGHLVTVGQSLGPENIYLNIQRPIEL